MSDFDDCIRDFQKLLEERQRKHRRDQNWQFVIGIVAFCLVAWLML